MHPILLRWSTGLLRSYTALVWAGYALGILWMRLQLKHHQAPPRDYWRMVLTLLAAALFGGKFGYYVVEWRRVAADPGFYWRHWDVGWVYWFGVLCVMAAGLAYKGWYNRTHRPRAYLPIADYMMTAGAMGHVLGRVGCFLEGCCWGRPTSLPWGVAFTSPASSVLPQLRGVPLHPTQLYEALGELAISLALVGLVLPAIRAKKLRHGTAFFGYLLVYSTMRFALEFLRGDPRGLIVSPVLSPSQWISMAVGAGAAAALWARGVVERDPASHSLWLSERPRRARPSGRYRAPAA